MNEQQRAVWEKVVELLEDNREYIEANERPEYLALYDKGIADANALLEQPEPAQPVADSDKVICPACCHQFRAIPGNVQRLMLDAGFEPPFTNPPAPVQEPVAMGEMSEDPYADGWTDAIAAMKRTTPPAAAQRQWVELTPEEIENCYGGQIDDFARALLAKSKERNT
jgi:hypothetical protein